MTKCGTRKRWKRNMIVDITKLPEIFKGKKVLLSTVTKDLINFLNLYQQSNKDFEILGVFDITLPYRPNVRALLEPFDLDIFEHIEHLSENAEIVLRFDHTVNLPVQYLVQEEYIPGKFIPKLFEKKVRKCYEEVTGGTEFTYMIYPKYQSFLIEYLYRKYSNSLFMDADGRDYSFSNTILPLNSPVDRIYKKEGVYYNLWDLIHRRARTRQKLIFVISSDFGIGKTRYCLEKNYISPDVYQAIFNPSNYYGNGGYWNIDKNTIYDKIIEKVAELEYQNNTEEIYIKIEGSLDVFNYPFVTTDCYYNNWGNLHNYFDNYEFHILHKDYENEERFIRNVETFRMKYMVTKERIKIIRSENHAQRFVETKIESNYLVEK